MQKQITTKTKLLLTGIAIFFIWSILLWDHFHGGVPSHHILDQKELPAISNWWGGLLLPILTWFLLGRIEKRISKPSLSTELTKNNMSWMIFTSGLSIAILISVSFINDYSLFLDNVLYAFVIISLIIPIFYSEFILGFILGMTFTFGAILPTVFILIMASLGFLTYRFIRPLILKLIVIVRNQFIKGPNQ